ncbi:MAG TPA: FCD domain-containing protein, partial [Solirubrobacteraceae bacterium]|nr:FCD domain-containing protein [Solirubrobacteraceae bacterium]
RVGFFVAELPTDDVEGVYHWRQVLEDEAHRIAVPRLEDSDLARMRKLNDSINRERESQNRFLDLNREFHFVAFGKTGSEILLHLLNQLWDSAARYQKTMDLARVSRAVLREHHAALIEAFEARDVNLVNALMAEHRALVPQSTGKITTRSTRAAAGA